MTGEQRLPTPSIEFAANEWAEEVERYEPFARARIRAEGARRKIESGLTSLDWKACEVEGAGGTQLPGCRKLYVPLGAQGASAAPYGFVFQLAQKADGSLVWNFIAFGERHPDSPRSRNVYERAHRRLHGRYP